MKADRICLLTTLLMLVSLCLGAAADEPLTLDNVQPPAANDADEPLAETFSADAATRFLDQAALDWTKNRKCFTCHTNYSYLLSRPVISPMDAAHRQVRDALEEMVQVRWAEQGPRWDAEVVMSAAVLAYNDAVTSGKLHPTTRTALDRMWTVQREDGGFDWLKCNWPPMESDDHYGATMAAIAVGVAPDGYADTAAAKSGMGKLRGYFKHNPPPTVHHRAMLLWVSTCVEDILTASEQQASVKELLALQKGDGGWGLATLGDWERADGNQQDTASSDGYGTGFVIFVLRRAGVAADDAQIQKGIAWLKANQRESGRWYTRSLNKDNKHYITHAGTAFALMALSEAGALTEDRE